MQATDGAVYIAEQMLRLPFTDVPIVLAGILFIIVAVMTNVLSNNACAILFTPIAVNMALDMNVDPYIFAVLVIFAANCSFASPIGYKTNLLVMGPGHYRFADFMKAGVPLVLIIWVAYIALAKFYYGL
jgi:di/tricarboxylate transporter